MKKYTKVTDMQVLSAYYELQSSHNIIGLWLDYVPIDLMAKHLKTSKYQVSKAYKSLKEKGYMQMSEIPIYYEEYYNGLYDEAVPILYTKVYILTDKGKEKAKENTDVK